MRLVARLLARQPYDRLRSGDGPALRRCLGAPGLIAVGLGTMLGGIFTTIGAGAATAGPGVIASFALSGLACVFVSLCYAELSSMVPIAGSAYTYAYATLGEFVAWIIGWDLLLEYGVSVAPTAAAWSGYAQSYLQSLGFVLPAWAQQANVAHHGAQVDVLHSQIDVFAIGIVLLISGLLAIGIRESAFANLWLVVVQVFSMVAFVVALLGALHPANFAPAYPTGLHGVVSGAALVFFAYIGFDTVTVASEEARRPERDVPLAVVGSLLIGAVLYIAIAWVTVGVVPWQHIDQNAGMADAVRRAGNNPWLSIIVTAGAIAGTTTVMITSMLGQIRIFYVMARDRMLPPFVASINERTRTPIASTIVTGSLVAVLAGVIPLADLLRLVNIGTLSAFAIVCAGMFVLRFAEPHAKRPFRAPLGPLVALLGVAMSLYLMTGLEWPTWVRFVVWFLVGVAIYGAYGFWHSLLRPRTAAESAAS